MELKDSKITVETIGGYLIDISVHEDIHGGLIMLHSSALSMQWPLNGTGVLLYPSIPGVCEFTKFAFVMNLSYQSFMVVPGAYDRLHTFFKALGFPVPKPIFIE